MNAVSTSLPADASPAAAPEAVPTRIRWPLLIALAALWAWAIAGCADEWTHNPMYSYGWFVPFLMLFFAWRRIDETPDGVAAYEPGRPPRNARRLTVLFAVAAVLVLPVEWFRQEAPGDRFNNWGVA
ncbi:MAG TPA: archaeosortase/exosortase family protein, partial [Verrucomicrobiota bacterium]|nr:archaeosortase/exosortase family protein [Verrucomicrobiota bacterium]